MLKKITAAALSTALCVTASIPFTGNCAAGVQPTNINLSAVRSADDIPVPADLRTGETPVKVPCEHWRRSFSAYGAYRGKNERAFL